ncbi:MAG: hypothetical protein ACHREM_01170 [Polyangiales bacterium]
MDETTPDPKPTKLSDLSLLQVIFLTHACEGRIRVGRNERDGESFGDLSQRSMDVLLERGLVARVLDDVGAAEITGRGRALCALLDPVEVSI